MTVVIGLRLHPICVFITGAQSATVVIGTTKTQGFCDFRCDGTNDAECFNKAI